jgi:hypothetical protein
MKNGKDVKMNGLTATGVACKLSIFHSPSSIFHLPSSMAHFHLPNAIERIPDRIDSM